MRGRLFRALITLATFAVVWLVAVPARASAPVCDPRGAIMFAPPPQIQDEERSIEATDACEAPSPLDVANLVRDRGGRIEISFAREPVTSIAIALPPPPVGLRVEAPVHTRRDPPRGVRTSIDRPPRS
jgi:hypothetical protein